MPQSERNATSNITGLEAPSAFSEPGTKVAPRQASAARQALAQARRIVIVTKFRFMGDTLVATPFLKQLRACYPHAAMTLLTSPSAAAALANCPYVDSLLSLEMQGISRWRHTQELWRILREGRYDAAFLLNRSLHCALTCTLAKTPVRIGYDNEHRAPFLTLPVPYFFDRNEVDSHLDMLRALELPAEETLPELWMTEAEKADARALLATHGWQSERPLIGVQPGANDPPIREWGAERYARVADTLARETGGCVVIMGGKAELETAERMAGAMKCAPVFLVGKLKLREALAAIGHCDLWLGNDTGLLHAAVAQQVASVGIFGPNKVVRWGYESPRHRSIVHFPERPARDDSAVRHCLDAIREEEVLDAARAVLHTPKTEEVAAGRPPYFSATRSPNALQSLPRR